MTLSLLTKPNVIPDIYLLFPQTSYLFTHNTADTRIYIFIFNRGGNFFLDTGTCRLSQVYTIPDTDIQVSCFKLCSTRISTKILSLSDNFLLTQGTCRQGQVYVTLLETQQTVEPLPGALCLQSLPKHMQTSSA